MSTGIGPRVPARLSSARPLVLVSAAVDSRLRRDITDGIRPATEYLGLEQHHAARLLDWTQVPGGTRRRSTRTTVLHVIASLRPATRSSVILSDGEHLGIPLALVLRLLRRRTPHLIIGHHLTSPVKRRILPLALNGVDRIIVHNDYQAELLRSQLRIPRDLVKVVPYGIDTAYWSPQDVPEESLVVATGREHRDYSTLAAALVDESLTVVITDSSAHSQDASRMLPAIWPENVVRRTVSFPELRRLYSAAKVVVVPLLPTDFSAGITATLEAMSMGKAVVVTSTPALSDIIRDGETGVVVPPRDVMALRASIGRLLLDPEERRRLGAAARRAVMEKWSLTSYVNRLAESLLEVTAAARKT